MAQVEDNESCKNLTILIGDRTGHRSMMQETVHRQERCETMHYTEIREDRLQAGGETRGSAGNWRQQRKMQTEDKTRYRQESHIAGCR